MPAKRKQTEQTYQTVINIRLNKKQSEKLETYCKNNKTNRTNVLRHLIEAL